MSSETNQPDGPKTSCRHVHVVIKEEARDEKLLSPRLNVDEMTSSKVAALNPSIVSSSYGVSPSGTLFWPFCFCFCFFFFKYLNIFIKKECDNICFFGKKIRYSMTLLMGVNFQVHTTFLLNLSLYLRHFLCRASYNKIDRN